MKFSFKFASLAGLAFVSTCALAQTYHAVELSSARSTANAANNGTIGGTVTAPNSFNSFGHATIWDTLGNATDVHPSFLDSATTAGLSGVNGIWNTTMAGTGRGDITNGRLVAMVWNSGTASFIPVPNGVDNYLSQAYATDGAQVAGEYIPWASLRDRVSPGDSHAYVYNIASNTVIDLYNGNPCVALDVKAGQQVGYELRGQAEARLWSGNAKTFVNLHPAGYATSIANALDGGKQVGFSAVIVNKLGEAKRGIKVRYDSACVWSGSATSVAFLSSAYPNSNATGVSGQRICGTGTVTNVFGTRTATHALVWDSQFLPAVELHDLLPANYVQSFATDIDVNGNVSGYGIDNNGQPHAIAWVRDN